MFSNKSQPYLRNISDIKQFYLRHISNITQYLMHGVRIYVMYDPRTCSLKKFFWEKCYILARYKEKAFLLG